MVPIQTHIITHLFYIPKSIVNTECTPKPHGIYILSLCAMNFEMFELCKHFFFSSAPIQSERHNIIAKMFFLQCRMCVLVRWRGFGRRAEEVRGRGYVSMVYDEWRVVIICRSLRSMRRHFGRVLYIRRTEVMRYKCVRIMSNASREIGTKIET